MRLLRAGVLSIAALALAACETTPAPASPLVQLDFLAPGVTTVAQCEQRLGTPSRRFASAAGGQVLTFRLGQDDAGLHATSFPGPWHLYEARLSLVAVFDSRGVLTRHALVKVKGR